MSPREQPPQRKHAATSFDVARRAGVSRAVVSRAFTSGSSISPESREKVLQAASELDYRVNQVARALNRKRSDLVGLVVSDMANPYRAAQIDALAKRIVADGYRPVLFCVDGNAETEQSISLLLNYSVSGVVVTSGLPPEAICYKCAERNVPLVIIDRGHHYPHVDQVTSDNAGGGREAAAKFMRQGNRHLVAVEPDLVVFSVSARVEGFKRAAKSNGCELTVIRVSDPSYASGQKAADSFASKSMRNAGVFCPTDLCALGFLDAMRTKHGADIPQELSVIGYDDIPQSSWEFANLTTFRQPVDEVAATTLELLESRFADPEMEERQVVLPVRMIERGTTLEQ